ncbi:MAG: hypothetical protein JNL87_13585 [Burkholderiaceae bacterium]|nr:hypothetical protein [Burkholderiaceae bacterium]
MRDLLVELKALRLHGMADAWAELLEQRSDVGVSATGVIRPLQSRRSPAT